MEFFSVKYLVVAEQSMRGPERLVLDASTWGRLWKVNLQDNLKLTLWKVAAGVLKTRGALARILHYEDENAFQCPFCKKSLEDSIHLLVRCSVASIAWRESSWAILMDALNLETSGELIKMVLLAESTIQINKGSLDAFVLNVVVVIDSLWFLRNKIIHENAQVDIGELVTSIRRHYLSMLLLGAAFWKVGVCFGAHRNLGS